MASGTGVHRPPFPANYEFHEQNGLVRIGVAVFPLGDYIRTNSTTVFRFEKEDVTWNLSLNFV
jgi:hypothetical protein